MGGRELRTQSYEVCKLKYENTLCKHVLSLEARLGLLYSACFWITFFFMLVIDTHVAVSFDGKKSECS